MHAHEHRLGRRDVPKHEGDVLAGVDEGAVADGGEVAEAARQPGLRDAFDERVGAESVRDHVVDGHDLDVVLARERDEVRNARDGAVLLEHLADDGGRSASGEAREVHGSLGVPGAYEHPAVAGADREDVAWPGELLGRRVRADEDLDGAGAVGRRRTA